MTRKLRKQRRKPTNKGIGVRWLDQAKKDGAYWRKTDPKVFQLINDLVEDTKQHPQLGLGSPKALRRDLVGWWSRRIIGEHRLVYRVIEGYGKLVLEIRQCRYHY
jgi:toxin YoeB